MKNGTKTIPTTETNQTKGIINTLNTAMTTVTDVQGSLEKSQIFLYDTLNDFFDHYAECENKDINTLTCMWHSAQHYRVYIETVLEYILRVSMWLAKLYPELEMTHKLLKGGVSCE